MEREGTSERIAGYFKIGPLEYGQQECERSNQTKCEVVIKLLKQQQTEINVSQFVQVLYKRGLDDLLDMICRDLHPSPAGGSETACQNRNSSGLEVEDIELDCISG